MLRILLPMPLAMMLSFAALANPAEDQAAANRLVVEAARRVQAAEAERSAARRAEALAEALTRLREVIDRFPGTDVGMRLAVGDRVGVLHLPSIEAALAEAELASCPERPSFGCLAAVAAELLRRGDPAAARAQITVHWLAAELIGRGRGAEDGVLQALGPMLRDPGGIAALQEDVAIGRGEPAAIRRALAQQPPGHDRMALGAALRLAGEIGEAADLAALDRELSPIPEGAPRQAVTALAGALRAAHARDPARLSTELAALEPLLDNLTELLPFGFEMEGVVLNRMPRLRAMLLARAGDPSGLRALLAGAPDDQYDLRAALRAAARLGDAGLREAVVRQVLSVDHSAQFLAELVVTEEVAVPPARLAERARAEARAAGFVPGIGMVAAALVRLRANAEAADLVNHVRETFAGQVRLHVALAIGDREAVGREVFLRGLIDAQALRIAIEHWPR